METPPTTATSKSSPPGNGHFLADIEITYFQEKDLEAVSTVVFKAFPDPFWDIFEPPEIRASEAQRIQRIAMRLRPLISQPCAHGLMAIYKPTREIVGVAVWHEPGSHGQFPTSYPAIPGVAFPSCFTPCFNRDTRDVGVALGWDAKLGYSSADLDLIWSGVSPLWGEIFKKYDECRVEVMGERPNWYLGPLTVSPSFMSRGIGSLLVRWGMDRAREQKARAEQGRLEERFKDVCCYLESEADARLVYMRLGFRPLFESSDDPEKQQVMMWVP